MLSNDKISDLFFNTEHPEFDSILCELNEMGEIITQDAIRKAIAHEAKEFAEAYPEFGKSATWYIDDFVNRS